MKGDSSCFRPGRVDDEHEDGMGKVHFFMQACSAMCFVDYLELNTTLSRSSSAVCWKR